MKIGTVMTMKTKYGFNIKVVVHTKHGTFTFHHNKNIAQNLEIHFSIPFNNDPQKDVSEVTIYNMSRSKFNAIKKGDKVNVYAGYGKDMGLLVHGTIYKTTIPTMENADTAYTLRLIEGADYTRKKKIKVTFKKRTTAKTIIRQVVRKSGIKLHEVSLKKDKVYKKGYTGNDHPMNILEEIADDCKTSLFYRRGKLTLRYVYDGKGKTIATISPATGLVSAPTRESRDDDWVDGDDNDGLGRWSWSIESILNYHITTFSRVKVHSKYVKQTLMVISGTHKFDGTSPRTSFEAVTK